MARATSSYKVDQVGDDFVFSVEAAEKRVPVIRVLFFSFLFCILLWNVLGGRDVGFLIAIVGAFFVYFAFRKIFIELDKKGRGQGGLFKVSRSGIELSDGVHISVDRIHRLILRNSFSDVVIPYSAGGVVAGGSGVVGLGMAMGASVGNALSAGLTQAAIADKNRNISIGYRLDVEFGGSAKTLATGMTETTAYGLLRDVGKILNLAAT